MEQNITALLRQQVSALETDLERERTANETLKQRVIELERAHAALLAALTVHEQYQKGVQRMPEGKPNLVLLTPKQHAVLQMVMRGAGNEEIVERFRVKPSTAKGFVRSIGKNFCPKGERITRRKIVHLAMPVIEAMAAHEYERMATIPKDWDASWTPADRLKRPTLYERRLED